MSRAVYEDDVIKLLNRGWKSGRYPLACDVRALPSAQPEKHTDERTETHACDLISRQAAIDAALTFLVEYCSAAFDEDMQKMLCERLDALPSARPEIVRCKDCKWKNIHNCTRAVEVPIDDDKYCAWAERRRTDD